jgi:hypothetical protein
MFIKVLIINLNYFQKYLNKDKTQLGDNNCDSDTIGNNNQEKIIIYLKSNQYLKLNY